MSGCNCCHCQNARLIADLPRLLEEATRRAVALAKAEIRSDLQRYGHVRPYLVGDHGPELFVPVTKTATICDKDGGQ
jgi:hypothetical protein